MNPLRRYFLLAFLPLFVTAARSQSDSTFHLEAFPSHRLFPKLLADGTAQQFSFSKDLDSRHWTGSIGGQQRIAQLDAVGLSFQLGIGATVYASLIRRPRVLDVVTADFFVVIPLEIRFSDRFVFRTGYGHYSAHFADDGIELLGHSSINYAKDSVPLMGALMLPVIGGFLYGGICLDYYTIPEVGKNWLVQFGAEAGNILLLPWACAYVAIDIKVKSEVAWATTQSYQVGVKMLERETSALRIAYTYRTGIDDRGQFYKDRIARSMLGIFFDM